MEHLLNNPVYNALLTGDAPLGLGTGKVKYFEASISPFAGFDNKYENGFEDLRNLLPQDRKIIYATPTPINTPTGWKLLAGIPGLQFVLDKYVAIENITAPVPLSEENVEAMMKLTALTKPGPFDKRTIEFGYYHGIFQNGELAAMTGQRLHVANFTEISAVCTHPNYLGKGFAGTLLHHQVDLILRMKQTPFLHVRADNIRAIELYKRIGFVVSRPMYFYFLQKE
ncbi:GNAT family N-acetyltransferase [soil metagenome]